MNYNADNLKFNLETALIGIFLLIFLVLPANVNSVFINLIAMLILTKVKRLHVQLNSLIILMFFYIFYNLISMIYTKNISLTIKESATWLIFLMVICISKNIDIFGTKLKGLLLAGIVVFNGVYIAETFFGIRGTMLFGAPTINCTAIIDGLAIIFIENQILLNKERKLLLARAIQLICIFTIIISNVRGVIALIGCYYVYHIFFKLGRKKYIPIWRKIVNTIGVLILFGAIIFMLPRYWVDYETQMENLFSLDVYSNKVRVLIYGKLIGYTCSHNILLGIGSGNFSEYYSDFGMMGFIANHSHSIFLQPFVELGIVGIIFILLIFTEIIKSTFKIIGEERLMYLEMIVVFLMYGAIDYVWVDLRVGIFFYLIVGQLMHTMDAQREDGIMSKTGGYI